MRVGIVRSSDLGDDWTPGAHLPKTYKVMRYFVHDNAEVIETGLTLEEAQAHCRRDDTHGDGWFDGYTEET